MRKLLWLIVCLMTMVVSVNAQNAIAEEFTKTNKAIGERTDKVVLFPNKTIKENYDALNNTLSLHRENNYAKYSVKVYGNYNGFMYELWELKIKPNELYLGDINEYIILAVTSIYTTSYEKPFNTSPDDYIDVGVNRKMVSVPTGRTFKTKDGKIVREYVKQEISQNTMFHLLPSSNLHKQIEGKVRTTIHQLRGSVTSNENKTYNINEHKTYDVVEQMPSFPGGQQAMMDFISSNLHYPIVAQENGVQGRVVVSFVVEKDGSLSDIKVTKSVDPSLDKEATRIVKTMPKWVAGKRNGSCVRVRYNVPISFRLQ